MVGGSFLFHSTGIQDLARLRRLFFEWDVGGDQLLDYHPGLLVKGFMEAIASVQKG